MEIKSSESLYIKCLGFTLAGLLAFGLFSNKDVTAATMAKAKEVKIENSAGFDGNLNSTIDDVQKLAVVVDDLSISGGGTWGSITGTLSNQTDLQNALNAKEPTLTKGNLLSGTGISLSGGTGSIIGSNVTVTNSAPDQTVALTGGGITVISGTYPNFTITSTEVDGSTSNELPVAGTDIDVSGQTVSLETTLDSVVKMNTVSEIAFDTTPTSTAATEGKLYWDNTEKTLEFDLTDGSISVNKEIFEYFTNLSGTTLVEGDVVSISGVSGGRTAITLTNAANNMSVENCIGVVTTASVAPNGIARVTLTGTVNMGTGSFTENPVYVDPANPGKWTQTAPTAPNFTVRIGSIKVAHAVNGELQVNMWKNSKFVDAADVNGTATTVTGQIPVWNQAAQYFDFTENIHDYAKLANPHFTGNVGIGTTQPSSALEVVGTVKATTFASATMPNFETSINGKDSLHGVVARSTVAGANCLPTNLTTTTFTLGATANPISYYFAGTLVAVTSNKTATLDDGAGGSTAGLYYVYFNGTTGNILATKTFPGISCGDNVIIANVFWNGTNYGLVGDERHAYRRDCEWHIWAHQTVGARYKSGFDFVPTGTGATATFTMSGGLIYDEDIAFTAVASSAYPTANALRTLYQTGASTYAFDATPSTIPYKAGTGSRPVYVNGSTYAVTTMDSASNRYINFFIYATQDIHTPVYCFAETLGAADVATNGHPSTADARAVPFPNLSTFGLSPELRPLYRLVVRANGVILTLTTADDYRTVSSLPMGAGTTSTTASAVSSLAYGSISSTNVQLALEELADEKVQIIGGNVGIGTTAPVFALDTIGTGNFSGNVNAAYFSGNGAYLTGITAGSSSWTVSGNDQYASTSGNVGIGSTAPAKKLDIAGNIGTTTRVEYNDGIVSGYTGIDGTNVDIGALSNHGVRVETNNLVRMSVTNGGNVGIGTTLPSTALDVAGSATVDGLNINSTYTFPTVDGDANQFLQTNGSGTISWATAAGGSSTFAACINLGVLSSKYAAGVDVALLMFPFNVTITRVYFTHDIDPTTELNANLKYADARIGLANSVVINDLDTTSGVRDDSSITSGSVASGKLIYMEFDAAPDSSASEGFLVIEGTE